jgi:hypothetical protein
MAAETSADAKVPVALALMKLSLLFSMKYLQEVSARIFTIKNAFRSIFIWQFVQKFVFCLYELVILPLFLM